MLDILSRYNVLLAFGLTLLLAFLSAIGALIVGTLVAILRLSPARILRTIGAAFVTIFINTPLTLLMVASILGFTYILGIRLGATTTENTFWWAVVMLSLYHAAFVCEALRSGVNTIPAGQAEAARSIGLTFGQSLREVILPQAFRGAIAPLGSTLIALIKNTTVAAIIGVAEAAGLMATIIENETGGLGVFFIFAVGFVILTLPLGVWFTELSRKLAVQR
jgi:glutamate transport system permease protein